MRLRQLVGFLFAIAWAGALHAADLPAKIEFNRDIRPILSENCYQCHGPDKNARKAELRLDTRDGLFSPIDGNSPIVPGNLQKSELYRRITTTDRDEIMPKPKSGKKLTAKQIALFKLWIEQGATWQGHWAYIKPVRSDPPEITKRKAQSANPIDLFIFAKLNENNLKPSPEAERTTLVRRLYFDLTGLPPTLEQVAAFVNDQSPNAYENLVEQLLASPHFGERMAIHWLDLVRYADSIGYHSDNPRDIAPYRDYVIKSFNDNKRFDQFTIEQLAGDLLPNPTIEQKVATGYNRLLQTTEEGGAQPKEYAAKYLADRVRNVSSVWLGATMGCCECHDHKFDPYATRDFYSMEAFFADVKEAAVGRREAGMPVPDEKQAAELKRFDNLIAENKSKLAADTPELAAAQAEWEKSLKNYRHIDWQVLAPLDVVATSGAFPKVNDDKSISITRIVPEKDAYVIRVKTKLKGITAFRLDALTEPGDKKTGPGRAGGGIFTLTSFAITSGPATAVAKAEPDPSAQLLTLQNASASYEAPRKRDKDATFSAASAITPDSGWSNAGHSNADVYSVFETAADFGDGGEAYLTFTLRFDAGKKQTLGRFKLSATTVPRPIKAFAGQDLPKDVAIILALDPAKRNEDQQKKLAGYHRSITPVLQPLRDALAKNEKTRDEFLKTVPKGLITIAETPRPVRILPRGNWLDDSGEIVQPAYPAFLVAGAKPPTTSPVRLTRLDLARWITSPDNPMAARVFVNRLWRLYFGTGISRSVEDFGAQGEWPTHPELLDYLATEFTHSGWDIKHMIRLMVTSTTYRQTSRPTKELNEQDPFNRLYARQSRFRMDAEIVRDNALAISGLLNLKIGGASARPYQPDGYWEYLNFPRRTWEQDKGENLYRRGLYTWWQRTFLHPSLLTFDAPSREECTAERARSNTPQQALVLLNDPTYVEAARVFAERIVREGGASVSDRLKWAFVRTLAREGRPEEISVLAGLFEKHQKEFAADKASAEKLISSGEAPVAKDLDPCELAAWTSISRALLNLHETITRY
ncbi:MAG TPA: PSD1 and planctomycete cytochrome C domain-containing protein [Tepidisphaeraceae bacterium]|nr:PSD1 and planctomycete cytochrome C domain-containing protein [Tepidisphaeraceae bacterium]